MEVNLLMRECAYVDEPLGFLCPELKIDVLRRYRQAMTPEMQRIGSLARAAYGAPPLTPLVPNLQQIPGIHVAFLGEPLYLADVEADRATFAGPCTLRPFQIIAHAVAVIDQLRWYRDLGCSQSACTYDIDTFAEALIGSLVTTGAHLWALGQLMKDELVPNAFLAGAAVEWTERLIQFVKALKQHSCHARDGKRLDSITALQGFHAGLPPEVEDVFREIERLMNELLACFPLEADATITTHAKTSARGSGASCGLATIGAD